MSGADDRPTPVPTGEPPPRKPDYPDPDDERLAIGEAWHVMMDPRREDDISDGPVTGLLFSAVALVYEGAEGDPPVCGVLSAIRDTVEGWAHLRTGSTLFVDVSRADLALMVRRVDVAMAMVRDVAKGGAR